MSTTVKKNTFRLAVIAAAIWAAQSFAELPRIDISVSDENKLKNGTTTCSGQSMNGWCMGGTQTTTYGYVPVTSFKLTDPNNAANNITRSSKPDSVKVRGNSTAGMVKKPYRIKFGDKIKVFGDTAAKSWVLLAEYFDATFALNAMAFTMGKRMGLEFTNRSWLVDVYINNQYKGLYRLTEQVQSHKGRVDLKEKHRGWLAEFDYHDPDADEKNQHFKTDKYDIGTLIKWPKLDDTSFTKNPSDVSQLSFVKTDINNLVNKMSEGGFPTNGYRDMIDLESWAKYVLIQLVMDNFDFNSKAQTGFLLGSNYCYRVDSAEATRIKAGPLWDFDLSAGVERTTAGGFGGTFAQHYRNYTDSIVPTHAFYKRLWEDPAFKAKYYKLWIKHKGDFQAMGNLIDSLKSAMSGSITGKGDNMWANNSSYGGTAGKLTDQTFNTEVQNLKTWWTNRLDWVDTKLKNYNIDTTKDVIQSAPPEKEKEPTTSVASFAFGKAGSGLSMVKNGLVIKSNGNTSIKVVTLSGHVVRKQTFAAGNHTVRMGDLPRGMYLVRVKLDGVKQTVRVAVR